VATKTLRALQAAGEADGPVRFLLVVLTVRFWASPPRCLTQRDWEAGRPSEKEIKISGYAVGP
jgi:hypothetical protein